MDPKWLCGGTGYQGVVQRFIPGQNDAPAMVVGLDHHITVDGVTGHILVLELRHVGATWSGRPSVHVELCDFEPESKAWQQRRQGAWVESHASVVTV